MPFSIRRSAPARPLVEVLTAAAEAGASLFQYRNKTASMKEAYVEALALRQAAAKAGVPLHRQRSPATWPWPWMPMACIWGRETCRSTWRGR